MDIVAVLLGLALVLAIGFWFIGVPILLLVRTGEIRRLRNRLDRLERQLTKSAPRPPRQAQEDIPVLEEVESRAETITAPQAPDRPRPAPRTPDESTDEPGRSFDWETWVGRRGLGWVAVVLLLFGVAFFLQQAFEYGWIGPLGRVTLGLAAGLALIGLGYSYSLRGFRLFSQMLTSGGAVLLYLSTFAAFGFYQLLPREAAGGFLVVTVLGIAGLALFYDAFAIALMAVIGGLLTPMLLSTGQDLYQALFLYLGLLNLGVVVLLVLRSWPIVGTVALAGTQVFFGAWMATYYHPEKLGACLLFQLWLFVLYLLPAVASGWLRRPAPVTALDRQVINAFLSATMFYVLLSDDYRPWMGTLALTLAVVFAVLAWFLSVRSPEDQRQLFVVSAIVFGLVALVFPWQAEVAWIGVGWAVEGLVLWWFGLRIRANPLRILGAVLLALAVGRLVFVDTLNAHPVPFVPVFNSFGLPALVIAACVIAVAAVSRSSPLTDRGPDLVGKWAAGVVGVLLPWLIFSIETYSYFTTQIAYAGYGYEMIDALGRRLADIQMENTERLRRTAQMALSLVWMLYAGAILGVGFWRKNPALRWTALGLFALTLAKVVLFDLNDLPGFYRVAVFLVLALVLGVAARIYQRTQPMRPAAKLETNR